MNIEVLLDNGTTSQFRDVSGFETKDDGNLYIYRRVQPEVGPSYHRVNAIVAAHRWLSAKEAL